MSTPLAHFAIGTGTTLSLYNLLPLHIRFKRKIVQVSVFVAGGLWALIPDISHTRNILRYINENYLNRIGFLSQMQTPELTTFTDLTYALHYSHWADIFFFHRLMDEGYGYIIYPAILLFLIISFAFSLVVYKKYNQEE